MCETYETEEDIFNVIGNKMHSSPMAHGTGTQHIGKEIKQNLNVIPSKGAGRDERQIVVLRSPDVHLCVDVLARGENTLWHTCVL